MGTKSQESDVLCNIFERLRVWVILKRVVCRALPLCAESGERGARWPSHEEFFLGRMQRFLLPSLIIGQYVTDIMTYSSCWHIENKSQQSFDVCCLPDKTVCLSVCLTHNLQSESYLLPFQGCRVIVTYFRCPFETGKHIHRWTSLLV